jgi:hypothetical protein
VPDTPSTIGSSVKERAVEALSYLITFTPVKDHFVSRPMALSALFEELSDENPHHASSTASISSSSTKHLSNLVFGIAYILHHVLTSESHLKKLQMQQKNMDITPEQYEQLQAALKQKSELDDGDSEEKVQFRLSQVLSHPQCYVTMLHLLKPIHGHATHELALHRSG